LDAKKAIDFGAKGPQLGRLKMGHDVTLEDGTLINANLCCLPATPGKKIVLLQVEIIHILYLI